MHQEAKDTNIKQTVPFFMVTDIDRSIAYYVEGLGFEMTNHWIDRGKIRWCWLQREGANLMLQEYLVEETRAKIPADGLGAGVSIWFICEDALSLYEEFLLKGIEISNPFVGNGMWVVHLKDPDGYSINFESKTDVPEETEYSKEAHG